MANRIYPNIQTYLKETKTTQEKLAKELGITQGALNKIIKGLQAPRLRLALRIEKTCSVPLESLLTKPRGDQAENIGNSCV